MKLNQLNNMKPSKLFDFMKYKYLFFIISLIMIIPGVFSLIKWGLKPSIDFKGGSVLEIQINGSHTQQELEDDINSQIDSPQIIRMGEEDRYSIRTPEITNEKKQELLSFLNEKYSEVEEIRFSSLGPSLGRELLVKTLTGVAIAALAILLFISLRFKEKVFGISAIIAMFHDSLILLGVFSLLGHFYNIEVDALFVTAILTILSFSVHDTVVVYDRIRELRRNHPSISFNKIVNVAIIQTLERSINNSMTIIFVLLSLFLLGGQSIKYFSLALLIGTIVGTYSSTFTAVPLLVWWKEIQKRLAS